MRRACLFSLFLFALTNCRDEPTPAPRESAVAPIAFVDRQNLFDLTRGSVVVDRTGESRLSASAIHAIDGSDTTPWSTPPGDMQQSLTIELTAPAQLERVGFSTGGLVDKARAAKSVAFETSLDGVTFETLATPNFPKPGDRQTVEVPPRQTRFVRATLTSNYGDPQVIDVLSLIGYGTQETVPRREPLTGEWTFNRRRARLAETDSLLKGEIELEPSMFLEGSWDENILRFVWVRGEKQFGVGLIAANHAADRLNSLWYFEEAYPIFAGEVWFGQKRSAQGTPGERNVLAEFYNRAGRVPIYDVRIALDEIDAIIKQDPTRRLRFVAHEFRGKDAADNRQRAELEIATLKTALESRGIDISRLAFVAAGSEQWRKPESTIEMVMFSRIMIEPER